MHEIIIALVIVTGQSSVLVKIYCSYLREINISFIIPVY